MARQSLLGQDLLLITEASRSHSDTHTHTNTRHDSSRWVNGQSQKPLYLTTHNTHIDNTQHSQGRDIHVPGWIRTYNPSMRAAADPRLRLRGHWGSAQGTQCNKFSQFTDYFCKHFNCTSVLTVLCRHKTTF